jgi:serine/threonine protein kinase
MAVKLDLKPYGINFVLISGKNTIWDIHDAHVQPGLFDGVNVKRIQPSDVFQIGDEVYHFIKIMGSGGFGTTYQVKGGPDDKMYALKRVKKTDDVFSEIVQQILVVNTTKDLVNGPYAPELYAVGYNSETDEMYILSELMEITAWDEIMSNTLTENDIMIPLMLKHISAQLDTLQTLLRFNHRDLKTNNLMFKTNPDGLSVVKFIDFGFSCMTWNGIPIHSGNHMDFSKCFRKTRDISQLIACILFFHKDVLSAKLKRELGKLIKIKYRGKTRRALNFIPKWSKTYKVFNRNNMVLEHGTPQDVYNEMQGFINASKSATPVHKVVTCPPTKILNPKTRRCVLRSGAIGRKLEQAQATASPAAAPAAAPAADDCPPGKVRNPKTRRCVKKDGTVAKRLGLY